MAHTKHATLVESAIGRRDRTLGIVANAMDSVSGIIALEEHTSDAKAMGPYAHALATINDHIAVPQASIDAASAAYEDIARRLVDTLKWPRDAIQIHPQGSALTQTLIRSPRREKFDIDAVCSVDISRTEAYEPMAFFAEVGRALEGLDAVAKKRCWTIPYPNAPYYLEFTPSVPIAKVPQDALNAGQHRLLAPEYIDFALAVVDCPTKTWKSSNPAGIGNWVDDVSKRPLVLFPALEKAAMDAYAGVAPVPDQNVEIYDTLRVAIRLFKRHRDMCVYRNDFEAEFQPISIIITTLLAVCYDGLFDLGNRYTNPVQLLLNLASILPHMVEKEPNLGYYVGNPTVEGENFAERWNTDHDQRARTFDTWCGILRADLQAILKMSAPSDVEKKAREVFGCHANSTTPRSGGPTPTATDRRPPPAVPRTSGLA